MKIAMTALSRLPVQILTLTFVCAVVTAEPVRAATIYAALASTTLTITSISNLTAPGTTGGMQIEGEASIFDSEMFALGDATALTNGDVDPGTATTLGVGDSLDLLATATGDAGTAGGTGVATSFFFTEGLVTLENTSDTDTYEVAFTYDYSAATGASVTDPLNEIASALAALSLSVESAVDPLVEELIEADTDFGLPGDLVVDSLQFVLSFAPGDTDSLFMLADAEGFAVSFAPEPISLPTGLSLLGLGLVALRLSKRGRYSIP